MKVRPVCVNFVCWRTRNNKAKGQSHLSLAVCEQTGAQKPLNKLAEAGPRQRSGGLQLLVRTPKLAVQSR